MLWPEPSSGLPASVCTWAKRKCGTKEGWSQSTFTRWVRTRDRLQESRCWALPSGLNSSSARTSKTASIRRGDCGRRFPTYPISSVVGRSYCRAPTQEPTTHCAPSHLRCPRIALWCTMKACGNSARAAGGDPTRRCTARERHRNVAHEDGRSRVEVCSPLCTRQMLCTWSE